jgi:cytochrome P450
VDIDVADDGGRLTAQDILDARCHPLVTAGGRMAFDRTRLDTFRALDTQRIFNEYQGFEVDSDPYAAFAELRAKGDILNVDIHDLLRIDPSIAVTVASTGYKDVDPSLMYAAVTFDAVSTILRSEGFSNEPHLRAHLPFLGKTVASMDGEEHRRNRGLVAAPFTRRAVSDRIDTVVKEAAEANAARLVRHAADNGGQADLLADFVLDYPARIIVQILGLSDDDVQAFVRTSFAMVTFAKPEVAVDAAKVIYDWIADVADKKRDEPVTDDLISQLAHIEVDGERLTTDEIAAFVRILFVGGFETTMKGLSNTLVGLLTTGQWKFLVEDRDLIPKAVDEGLRWETSVLGVPRFATRDHDLFGVRLPAGAAVMCFTASANRDEKRWTHPDRFDLTRENRQSAAFGFGPHMCLGMNLAKAEMAQALHSLVDTAPGLALVDGGDDDIRIRGLASRGPAAIPVRLEAALSPA